MSIFRHSDCMSAQILYALFTCKYVLSNFIARYVLSNFSAILTYFNYVYQFHIKFVKVPLS